MYSKFVYKWATNKRTRSNTIISLDNDSCLLSGFEEREEFLNDCPFDSDDTDSVALARKRVRRRERRCIPSADSS
jgi:hypothetical protein